MIDDILNNIDYIQKHIKFDDLMHQYWYDGHETISVTQLLSKHGLSPDYSNVNSKVLEKASERGKIIHKEIEEFVNNGINPTTEEAKVCIELLKENNIQPVKAEFMVANEMLCGTVDLIGTTGDKIYIIDHKTGSTIHEESVRWQTSIYAYLLGIYDNVENVCCVHLPKSKNYALKKYDLIDKKEIEKLLECEKNGTVYNKANNFEIDIRNNFDLDNLKEISNRISQYEDDLKALKQQREIFKSKLLEKMQENNIWKINLFDLDLTRIKASQRKTINTSKLKEKYPDIAKEFEEVSDVGENLRIKIGGTK